MVARQCEFEVTVLLCVIPGSNVISQTKLYLVYSLRASQYECFSKGYRFKQSWGQVVGIQRHIACNGSFPGWNTDDKGMWLQSHKATTRSHPTSRMTTLHRLLPIQHVVKYVLL